MTRSFFDDDPPAPKKKATKARKKADAKQQPGDEEDPAAEAVDATTAADTADDAGQPAAEDDTAAKPKKASKKKSGGTRKTTKNKAAAEKEEPTAEPKPKPEVTKPKPDATPAVAESKPEPTPEPPAAPKPAAAATPAPAPTPPPAAAAPSKGGGLFGDAGGPAASPTASGYLVLARKYRPQTFDDVIGQEHVTQTLKNAIAQDRVHHAYLFNGSRGIGKTSTARILAKALNCLNQDGPTPEPCGQCSVCRQISTGRGAEGFALTEMDGASNNSVDDVRDLRSRIGQKTGTRYHVVIIDEVHMLSTAAFNALLKTLEEPPPHVKFVFATTEVQKVPETIISRCQRFDFRRIRVTTLAEQLADVAGREGINLDAEAGKLIARVAEGGMRDSLSKLDQAIAFCGTEIKPADIERIFGILSRRALLDLVTQMRDRDFPAVLEVARRVHEEGLDTAQVLRDLIDVFRDLMVIKTCGHDTPLVDAVDDDREQMKAVGDAMHTDTLLYAIEILAEGQERLRTSGFPRLALEATFLKLCEMEDLVAIPDLIDAIRTGGSGASSGTSGASATAGLPGGGAGSSAAASGGERRDFKGINLGSGGDSGAKKK